MEVSAQREQSTLPEQLRAERRWSPQPATGFHPRHFVVYFQRGSRRGHKRWISLVGRRDERALRWGGERERSIPPFPFIVPYECSLRSWKGSSTKELYIADKWWGLHRFFLVLPLSEEARLQRPVGLSSSSSKPLEETHVKWNIYTERVMYDECARGYKTQTLLREGKGLQASAALAKLPAFPWTIN